jgi:hypothetical protein
MRRLFAALLFIVLAASLASHAQAAPASDRPFVIEYYYKTKWGHADEFLKLFKKNHYPVLKKEDRCIRTRTLFTAKNSGASKSSTRIGICRSRVWTWTRNLNRLTTEDTEDTENRMLFFSVSSVSSVVRFLVASQNSCEGKLILASFHPACNSMRNVRKRC